MNDYDWDKIKTRICELLVQHGYETDDGIYYKKERASFFIIPLSELQKLRNCRCDNDNYSSPSMILIKSSDENPFVNNESIDSDTLKLFFGNPRFGNIKKAIFFGECDDIKNGGKFIFDTSQYNSNNKLLSLIKGDIVNPEYKKNYLKKYYETFVDYYFPDGKDITDINNINFTIECKIKEKEDKDKTIDISISKDDFEVTEKAYCKLNGINYDSHVHRVKFELFRAPVPFPLQKLVDAEKKIKVALGWNSYGQGKRIKLLLIDNKTDKFKEENKDTIFDALSKFDLNSLFDISMLRGYPPDESFDSESERFHYGDFKGDEDYRQQVYEKLKDAHFVFLDFFLDPDGTYLAFDFIKDISKIKKQKGDYSTTWYFITSAVYDSVVKYSQSGLLAEYYESAVVNAGDDPTNEKRQIIFVYKLLTFIQSRLRNFRTFKDTIYNLMLNDEKKVGKGVCCVTATNKNMKTEGCLESCEKDDCLEKMQTHIKRYLTEYDNIWSLFYDEKHKRDYKDIAVLLDDTIKKFLWLPEADWQRIQHQIDYINAKFKSLGENRMFSCKYINGEIEKRSEIY